MIVLHRKEEDPLADEIEQKLENLVISFRTETHNGAESHNGSGSDQALPQLEEGGQVVSGEENLNEYLDELEQELTLQRSISGDACYLDPETGKPC